MGEGITFQYFAMGFGTGVLTGVAIFLLFALRQADKAERQNKEIANMQIEIIEKEAAKLKKRFDKKRKLTERVTAQLDEASKIIETQNNLAAALQQPSKNAPHSRYKNRMAADWKALEDKKQDIFASILKSGADPVVQVYDDEIKKTRDMKLSELMQAMGINPKSGPPPSPQQAKIILEEDPKVKELKKAAGANTTVKKKVVKGRTFYVIENKDDKTNH